MIKKVRGGERGTVNIMKMYNKLETFVQAESIIKQIGRDASYIMTEEDPHQEINLDNLPKIEVVGPTNSSSMIYNYGLCHIFKYEPLGDLESFIFGFKPSLSSDAL